MAQSIPQMELQNSMPKTVQISQAQSPKVAEILTLLFKIIPHSQAMPHKLAELQILLSKTMPNGLGISPSTTQDQHQRLLFMAQPI